MQGSGKGFKSHRATARVGDSDAGVRETRSATRQEALGSNADGGC
jgi:hypothetical protein